MPTSSPENKTVIADWYRQLAPTTVVDIGPGEGTYAKLLRPQERQTSFWTAVEVWGPYVARYGLQRLYDQVVVADARYVDDTVLEADLAIAGDVLEHMPKAHARALIRRLQANAANVFISVPVLHLYANDIRENPYEEHIEHWHHDEMVGFLALDRFAPKGTIVAAKCGDVLSYAWWKAD